MFFFTVYSIPKLGAYEQKEKYVINEIVFSNKLVYTGNRLCFVNICKVVFVSFQNFFNALQWRSEEKEKGEVQRSTFGGKSNRKTTRTGERKKVPPQFLHLFLRNSCFAVSLQRNRNYFTRKHRNLSGGFPMASVRAAQVR